MTFSKNKYNNTKFCNEEFLRVVYFDTLWLNRNGLAKSSTFFWMLISFGLNNQKLLNFGKYFRHKHVEVEVCSSHEFPNFPNPNKFDFQELGFSDITFFKCNKLNKITI